MQPVALDFPDLHTGETSASESLKVSNLGGTADLLIGAVTITGPGAANFSLTNGCTAAVAPDAECLIDVRFNPTVAGDVSASLEITHNVGIVVNPLVVPLTGRGFDRRSGSGNRHDGVRFPELVPGQQRRAYRAVPDHR